LNELLADRRAVVLEIGPGSGMSGLIKNNPGRTAEQEVLSSLRHPKDRRHDFDFLLHTLGALWLAGVQLNWPELYGAECPRRIHLPTYPFERKRYWIDRPVLKAPAVERVELNENNDAAIAQPETTSAYSPIPATVIPVQRAVPTQGETRGDGSPHYQNNGTTIPTPAQQIIARQLQISAEQIKLMALQIELVRNGKPDH
jgi:acyl transferase domain-containing protein